MTLTDENRAKLNALVRTLKQQAVTKEQVMGMFDVSERVARDMLREVALRVPLIALSDSRGYRLANAGDPRDIADAKHMYRENQKRAQEILKRNVPLKTFLGIVE